jgi:hypothetical protein
MDNDDSSDRSSPKRHGRLFSRPRIVMFLLLIVAIPIFVALANRAVNENSGAIRQIFGH